MQTLFNRNIQNIFRYGEVSSRVGRKCRHDLRIKRDSGVNEKQTVFLMLNGVNIISYANIYMCVLRPLTNDLWVFLFQKIDAEYVK